MYIYSLKCEQNKYYVGRTNNVDIRYQQHLNGEGSQWTRKYKPISILNTYSSNSPFDEDKTTKELMVNYGIDNVRGGSYVTDFIPDDIKKVLQKELWACMNYCVRCGKPDHFIDQCKSRKDVNGTKLESKYKPKIKKNQDKPTVNQCKKCGRFGHVKKDCYATTKLDGSTIKIKKCSRCGRAGHLKKDCYAKTNKDNDII
jgi:hypothetical protein